ncbi:hypothetical protein [Streptobacillus moniliformis]|nr:hypothetical protein [Streptobacillus moniliformis]
MNRGKKKRLKTKCLEMPKSRKDIIDSKFKREIIVAHQGSS